MLFGIFVWGLLFLAIFIYFTNSNPAAPMPSSFSFLESRGLLPVQGKQRVIMGALQEPSLPRSLEASKVLLDGHPVNLFHRWPGDPQKWDQPQDGFGDDFFTSQVRRKSQSALYPEEDSYFFVAGQPGLYHHRQDALGLPSSGETSWRSGATQPKQEKLRHSRRASLLEEAYDSDMLSASMSRAFLYRLWKGTVSSKMLNPRLQKAMRYYMSFNKHGVRFRRRGRRETRRTGPELLCEMRRRVRVRTLDGKEAPFSGLGWRPLVPGVPLSQLHPRGLRSCAVVMSSGAILNSSLGEEIGGSRGGSDPFLSF